MKYLLILSLLFSPLLWGATVTVPQGSDRKVDGRGNTVITTPDQRRIEISRSGQVKVLDRSGRVLQKGRFQRWQAAGGRAGLRAGGRWGLRDQKGVRANRGIRKQQSGRYSPTPAGIRKSRGGERAMEKVGQRALNGGRVGSADMELLVR